MNFWNNPENNSLKTLIMVAVVVLAGFFIFKYMHLNSLGGKGQVIDTDSAQNGAVSEATAFTFKTQFTGKTCTMTVCSADDASQCIPLTGVTSGKDICTLDKVQFAPYAQDLLPLISSPSAQ